MAAERRQAERSEGVPKALGLYSDTPLDTRWLCNLEKVCSGKASVSLLDNERFALNDLSNYKVWHYRNQTSRGHRGRETWSITAYNLGQVSGLLMLSLHVNQIREANATTSPRVSHQDSYRV